MRIDELRRNRLLDQLGDDDLHAMVEDLEGITMAFKDPIHEQAQPVETVYFPFTGLISMVSDLADGDVVETGTIGREGMAGLSAFLGTSRSPGRTLCQIAGTACRMRSEALLTHCERQPKLRQVLLRHANTMMAVLARTAACNRAHGVDERLARWLLTTRDRADSDEFTLTQEFLAQMLGVRRPSVSIAGAALQRAGLITYSRGRIKILDPAGLEEVSCGCYRFIRDSFEKPEQAT